MSEKFILSLIRCKLCLIAALVLFAADAFAAGTYYIRDGATGTSCTDWTLANACDKLPSTLERGATYFVAGGFYDPYIFTTPEEDSLVVTVKKATKLEHGTGTGWVDALGTTQAEFRSYFNIARGFFVLDGSYRKESDWFNGSEYGFKIQESGNWQHMRIFDPAYQRSVSDIKVKYLYIKAIVGALPPNPPTGPNNHCYTNNDTGQPVGPCAINTNTESAVRGYRHEYSHIFIEGGNNPFFLRNTVDPLLEYSASSKTSGSGDWHGEIVNRYFSPEGTRGGGVIRFNHFRDCYNGASGFSDGGSTGVIVVSETSGIEIYGNVFEDWQGGNGAIGAGWTNKNMKVFNNTIVDGVSGYENADGTVGNAVQFPISGTGDFGNEAFNNLTANISSWKSPDSANFTGNGTFGNNLHITDQAAQFVSPNLHNFRLKKATSSKGRTLTNGSGQLLTKDMDNQLRNADSFWDIGAFEFNSGSNAAPSAPSNLSIK